MSSPIARELVALRSVARWPETRPPAKHKRPISNPLNVSLVFLCPRSPSGDH